MDVAEFRRALHLGLGRATIYAREHDVHAFREVILDACLHCYAYDVQLEGTRGSYMYELVGYLPDKDYYYDTVLQSLPDSVDDYDAVQRFHFAACMASDGHTEARQAMYDSYSPGPRRGESSAINFINLDGIQGFLFAAEKIGALLLAKPADVDEGYLLSVSIEELGEESVWSALKEAAATNPRIEAYRAAAQERHDRSNAHTNPRPALTSLTYEHLFEGVPHRKSYLLWKWGEQASDEELELAAKGLLAAANSKDQLAHLWIFQKRRFPLDVNALLALVDIKEDRVCWAAINALGQISHPAVRALAFRLIDSRDTMRGGAIALIAQNFEPGDHSIVLQWFEEEQDNYTLHSFYMDLRDVWERYPDKETEASMLRVVYEKEPSSFCRETAVQRFIEIDALPDDVRAECAWDANYDLRELVK